MKYLTLSVTLYSREEQTKSFETRESGCSTVVLMKK